MVRPSRPTRLTCPVKAGNLFLDLEPSTAQRLGPDMLYRARNGATQGDEVVVMSPNAFLGDWTTLRRRHPFKLEDERHAARQTPHQEIPGQHAEQLRWERRTTKIRCLVRACSTARLTEYQVRQRRRPGASPASSTPIARWASRRTFAQTKKTSRRASGVPTSQQMRALSAPRT